jgi:hypothetical protein
MTRFNKILLSKFNINNLIILTNKFIILSMIIFIVSTQYIVGLSNQITVVGEPDSNEGDISPDQLHPSSPKTRSDSSLFFLESSQGLPKNGDYNFIALEDINNDDEIDIAFGSGGWPVPNTFGLYAYTGDGGNSWEPSSNGLSTRNTWGGLELTDADEDGYIELYAPDEPWGSSSNSGLKVWEYRDGSWTDSIRHISTPVPYGVPNNVVLADVTGNSREDMVVCKNKGLNYFQNNGGNPVTWEERSEGLSNIREFTGAAIADINKDGLSDIVASDYSGNEYIYIQSSTGDLWSDYSASLDSGGITYGIEIGDVNDDSHMDLVFGTTGGGLLCWLGNSGGSDGTDFQWVNGSADLISDNIYNQIQLVDIDQDGDLDIIGPEGNNEEGIQIYLGNGNTAPGMDIGWELAKNTNLPDFGNWYGANYADINDDGFLDIVGASWGYGVRVWLNNINSDLKQFNLHITDDDLAFSTEQLYDGEEVTIKVTITNNGELDAPEFMVKFLIDNQQLDTVENVVSLSVNNEIQLEKTWMATQGEHTVRIEVEVANNDFEVDIGDNFAERKISVRERDTIDPVDNKSNSSDGSTTFSFVTSPFFLITVILIIVIVLIIVMVWRRKRTKTVQFIEVEVLEPTGDDKENGN